MWGMYLILEGIPHSKERIKLQKSHAIVSSSRKEVALNSNNFICGFIEIAETLYSLSVVLVCSQSMIIGTILSGELTCVEK